MFGRFLIQRGLAKPDQVVEALALQRERTPLIGRLALKARKLRPKDTWAILEHQVSHGGRFLEIAVELGMLSPKDAHDLLAEQSRSRPRIGELLVELGAISEEQLHESLAAYRTTKDARLESLA